MMVTLALMHVVGFKMPVNMIFDVEVEGFRLCSMGDLDSSWLELPVKVQVWIITDHFLPTELLQNTAFPFYISIFMTKLYRCKSGFQSKAYCQDST